MEAVDQKISLPNAAATLVLGILSLVPFCGPLNLILGIIGLVISREGKQLYMQNPEKYTGYGNLNAGRILCIIGIIIEGSALVTLLFLFAVGSAILGSVFSVFGTF